MPKHARGSPGGITAGTLRSEIHATSSQLSSELLRAALEPTVLSLETTSESPGCPLSLCVAAPRAMNACDIELEIDQPWCSPFRLVRVAVRLPAEIASLNRTDFDAAMQCLILNMKAEATLEVPGLAADSSGEVHAPILRSCRLQCVPQEATPRYGRCVLIEIPVPAGITLRPGAAISLSVSHRWIPHHPAHPCRWPHPLRHLQPQAGAYRCCMEGCTRR